MGFWKDFGDLLRNPPVADDDYDEAPEEYVEEYEEEEYDEPAPAPQPRMRTTRISDRDSNLVLHYPSEEMKVVIVRPRKYDEAPNIAMHIKERRTVVLNLEHTDKNISRRIVDFLSGAAYVIDGDFEKVSANTFIITPKTISVIGADAVENENTPLYYESN